MKNLETKQQLIHKDYVLKYVNSKIDVPIGEIISYLQSVKIQIGPKALEQKLLAMAKENNVNMSDSNAVSFMLRKAYTFKPIDYKLKAECFDIYKNRCTLLCKTLMMLGGLMPVDKQLFEELDIELHGETVSKIDIARIAVPLVKNYQLLIQAKENLEDPETYTRKISPAVYSDYVPPKTILQPSHFGDSNGGEYVPMTERQKAQARENLNNTMKEIFDRLKN